MQKKHIFGIGLLTLAAAVLVWLFGSYHLVEFRFYRRGLTELDLRGQEIPVSHYEKLTEKMPDTRILWDVPFQGGTLSQETQTLTVTALAQEEAGILARYLPRLRTVHAESCADYDALLQLKQQRPDVNVLYRVPVDGKAMDAGALQMQLEGITEEALALLRYLPNLKFITISGGEAQTLRKLQAYCREQGILLRPRLKGEVLAEDTRRLTVSALAEEQAELLVLLPELKQLHLIEPEARAETVLGLPELLPETEVTWEKTILGKTFSWDATEIDLTDVISRGIGEGPLNKTGYQYSLDFGVQGTREEVPASVKLSEYHRWPDKTASTAQLIAEAGAAMDYFPNAETLVMCGSFLDNEAMAAFREARREEYKVVWSVKCGKLATRTDARFFMPVKYHVYYLQNEEAANLRYCPELVSVDIGHMSVSDISFVEYLPNLEHLILAHTGVRDIEPLRSCKNLKFLELDWTGIQDFSPLLDCTGLEDLNVGNTWGDIEPLKGMTWLKNLWMIYRREGRELAQALPDTRVVYTGTATVDSGWRDLPNYFAMRDNLMMYYMSW